MSAVRHLTLAEASLEPANQWPKERIS